MRNSQEFELKKTENFHPSKIKVFSLFPVVLFSFFFKNMFNILLKRERDNDLKVTPLHSKFYDSKFKDFTLIRKIALRTY